MLKLGVQDQGSKLQLLAVIIAFGFIQAIVYHGILTWQGYSYPINTFLFQPWDRFHDFIDTYQKSKNLDPYANFTNYFPFAYLIIYPFTFISDPYAAVMLFITLFLCFLCCNANYFLAEKGVNNTSSHVLQISIVCLLSYPTWFCLDRGNLDVLVYIFCALFLITFIKEKYWLAALCLAIAVSMKLFPVLFILLFLKRKQFRAVLVCLLSSILLSVLALAIFKSGFKGFSANILSLASNFNKNYAINDMGLTSSISLFTLIKVVMQYWYLNVAGTTEIVYRLAVSDVLYYYTLISVVTAGLLALYVLLVKQELWQDVMIIVIMLVMLPAVSGDYRLIFFYLPLFVFLSKSKQESRDRTYTILFGLLFIPKNFFFLPQTKLYAFECFHDKPCGTVVAGGYSVMSLLNIIILVSFLGLVIWDKRRKGESFDLINPPQSPFFKGGSF